MLRFTGFLDTSEIPSGDGFRVKLFIDADRVEISSSEGETWKWDADDVDISRVKIDRFRLDLGTEELYFMPDDPIAFTLHATTSSEPTQAADSKRGWLRRRLEEATESAGEPISAAPFSDAELPSDDDVTRGKRRRSSHTHSYEHSTAAGVVRRRCTECGQVSIDLSQVTSAFEMTPAGQ